MDRKIVERLALGEAIKRISRELKVGRSRVREVRGKAKEAGYLDGSTLRARSRTGTGTGSRLAHRRAGAGALGPADSASSCSCVWCGASLGGLVSPG
jgi:hypothetical protein